MNNARWTATVELPISLILGEDYKEAKFKANFFRVDLFKNWDCAG